MTPDDIRRIADWHRAHATSLRLHAIQTERLGPVDPDARSRAYAMRMEASGHAQWGDDLHHLADAMHDSVTTLIG
jgi:hypothetical protein